MIAAGASLSENSPARNWRQETGGKRRQETGGKRRQETGDRRQETGGKRRQETGGKRKKEGVKRSVFTNIQMLQKY